jgi:hypothetical protein
MDWNRIEGNWKQMKGKVKEQRGKLTDVDDQFRHDKSPAHGNVGFHHAVIDRDRYREAVFVSDH